MKLAKITAAVLSKLFKKIKSVKTISSSHNKSLNRMVFCTGFHLAGIFKFSKSRRYNMIESENKQFYFKTVYILLS